MADWHILHLTFDPPIDTSKLERLTASIEEIDYDFPDESITVDGTRPKPGNPDGRLYKKESSVRWRSPLLSQEKLIKFLEDFEVVGHGWLVRQDEYSEVLRMDACNRFTFGGGFEEIDVAAKWERERKHIELQIQTLELGLLETARLVPFDLERLRSAAMALQETDRELDEHIKGQCELLTISSQKSFF